MTMKLGKKTVCENCGRLKPQFAQGYGRDAEGRGFKYIGSPLCIACRHAPRRRHER